MKRRNKAKAKKFFLSPKGKLTVFIFSLLFFIGGINYGILNEPYFPIDTPIGFLLMITFLAFFLLFIICIVWFCLKKGSEKAPRYFTGTSSS